jgi:hypothetical protein
VERVGEHPVPVGPLAARWRAYHLEPARAGAESTARLLLENVGSATWRSRGTAGIQASYHWLDERGNAIFWDGIRNPLPAPVAPGATVELTARVRAPRPPGRYRLAFDLVDEHNFWFAEVGNVALELPVEVAPRIAERRLSVVVHGGTDPATSAALRDQDEPVVEGDSVAVAHLVAGAVPSTDWSRRLLDGHAEGFAAVGSAIVCDERASRKRLAGWAPGGRNPRFALPLLLPSLLTGLEPGEHEGLPSHAGDDSLFDGRATVRLRRLSGRRPA